MLVVEGFMTPAKESRASRIIFAWAELADKTKMKSAPMTGITRWMPTNDLMDTLFVLCVM
jgi:hypothetical protein